VFTLLEVYHLSECQTTDTLPSHDFALVKISSSENGWRTVSLFMYIHIFSHQRVN